MEDNSFTITSQPFLDRYSANIDVIEELDSNYLSSPDTIGEASRSIKSQKPVVLVLARQHPGETVSSFVMQGLIDYLVSDSKESEYLRENFIFKLVPMVNPDGVIYGNFR